MTHSGGSSHSPPDAATTAGDPWQASPTPILPELAGATAPAFFTGAA